MDEFYTIFKDVEFWTGVTLQLGYCFVSLHKQLQDPSEENKHAAYILFLKVL